MAAVDLSTGVPAPTSPGSYGGGGHPPMSQAHGGGSAAGYYHDSGGGYSNDYQAQMAEAAFRNPDVQAKLQQAAYEQGGRAIDAASTGMGQLLTEMKKSLREGPAGIAFLCFIGGIATTVFGLCGLVDVSGGFSSPFQYVLNIYLTGFGVVIVLLEGDMENLRNVKIIGKLAPVLEKYQVIVFTKASFLTELRGRALFYIFIGSLAVTQCWFCMFFFCGLWNLAMGIFCLMMSFGINPADHLPTGNGGGFAPPGGGHMSADPHAPLSQGY